MNNDENLLIQFLRETNLHPSIILIGLSNDFKEDNESGKWDNMLEIIERYLFEYGLFDGEE